MYPIPISLALNIILIGAHLNMKEPRYYCLLVLAIVFCMHSRHAPTYVISGGAMESFVPVLVSPGLRLGRWFTGAEVRGGDWVYKA